MTADRRSLQDLIRARQQRGFFGRRSQVTEFQENLTLPVTSVHRRFIFNIYGDAGVGKTYLTKYLLQNARDAGILVAYIDEAAADPLAAMSAIADEFARADYRLTEFEKRADAYRQRRYELESDPNAPEGLSAFLTKTAVLVALAAARDVPIAGSLLAPVDAAAAAEQANQARSYIARKLRDHTDMSLLISPTDELTRAFVRGLNRVGASQQLAFFFDTYERTSQLLDRWLRDLYAGRYGDLPVTLVSTISGQYPLNANSWADYISVKADVPLEPFTVSEARQFLASKGIIDEFVVDVILNVSGRLPMWLATLADATPDSVEDIGDPAGDAVGRFLKWEEDPAKRAIAIVAALPRTFNQDILGFLAVSDEARKLFTWLIELPFVSRQMGAWRYHDVVRSAMIRLERAQSPSEWRANHLSLASGYMKWAAELAGETNGLWTNAEWVDHTCEKIYHLLCADPASGLPEALATAVNAAEIGIVKARQWATLFGDAGRDTENTVLLRWAECLQRGISEDRLDQYLTCLIDRGHLDERMLSVALRARGDVYKASRHHEEALADFNHALEINSADALVLASRGSVYVRTDRYDQAIADLNRAVELDPDKASVFVSRGLAYLATGRFEEALADFGRAVELDSADIDVRLLLGITYSLLGRSDDALTDLDHVIDIAQDFNMAWVSRGLVRHLLERDDEALADLDRAVELDPDNLMAYAARGMAYQNMGRYEDALADLDRAVQLDPDNTLARLGVEFRIGREDADQQMGHREDVRAGLARAIGDSAIPAQMETMSRIQRARTYQDMGRYEEALADLDRAVELDPDNFITRVFRGAAYQNMGRYEEALADLDRAIELGPDNLPARSIEAMAHVERGKAYQNMGRYEEARADFHYSITVDPSLASEVSGTVAEVYLMEGKPELAASILEAVIKAAPDLADAHNNYGFCLLPIDAQRAFEELEVANELQPHMLLTIANEVLALHLLERDDEALALGNSDKVKTLQSGSGLMWDIDTSHMLRLRHWNDVREYLRELLAHIERHD